MPISSSELLDKVVAGDAVTADDIEDLLKQKVPEDQFLEYKDGRVLSRPRQASEVIREYLTGFANAAGGVLIIGVAEANWSVTGATAPGGQALGQWAKNCVLDLAGQFSPLPRFQVVSHPRGQILVAGAARSANLVPDIRGRELIYHLRIHDSTVRVPEYLMVDLVLGRRQHPILRIVDCSFANVDQRQQGSDYTLRVRVGFQAEIDSLAWAENLRMGVIAYNHVDSTMHPISKHLSAYLDIRSIDGARFPYPTGLNHLEMVQSREVHGPFAVTFFTVPHSKQFSIPVRKHGTSSLPYIWQAAAYLISRNSPPAWYQVNLKINHELLELVRGAGIGTLNARRRDFLEIIRCEIDQPVVAWTPDS